MHTHVQNLSLLSLSLSLNTHTNHFHSLLSFHGQRIKLFVHGVSSLTRVFRLGQVVDVLQPSSRLSSRLADHLLHFVIILKVREG